MGYSIREDKLTKEKNRGEGRRRRSVGGQSLTVKERGEKECTAIGIGQGASTSYNYKQDYGGQL